MSDAYRRVTIEYEVKLDRNGHGRVMKEMADGAKRANGEASKAMDQRVKHERAALSQLAKEYGYASDAQMKQEKAFSDFQMKQRQARLRDEQRHQKELLRETQRATKEREREEARATKTAEAEANKRATAEQVAASKSRAANAQAVEGFRMLTGGIGQAVRSLGYLAAADKESAESMARMVVTIEGVVQGIQTITTVGYGAVKMWRAYKAAQAAGGAMGIGMRAVGMAGAALPIAAAGAAAAGGIWASGIPQRAYDWATGTSGKPGSYNDRQGESYLRDASGMNSGFFSGVSYYGGEALSLGIGRRERAEAASMYKKAKEDEAAAVSRGDVFERNQAVRWAKENAYGAAETDKIRLGYQRDDALAAARPDYMGRGVDRFGRAEGMLGGARSEALAEERARILGQPMGTYSITDQLRQRGEAERARAMDSVRQGQLAAKQDVAREQGRLSAATGAREAAEFSRKAGGDIDKVASQEQVNRLIEHESMARQRLAEAVKREGEVSRQAAQLKLEAGRNLLQNLEQQRDMYREIASQMRGEQRSAGIRYGELNPEERAKVDEAKRAYDAGMPLAPEQRATLREYGGRGINRKFDEQALAKAPDWVRQANEKEAQDLESKAKTLDLGIKAQHDINLKIEGDMDKIADSVFKAVGQQVQEYFSKALAQVDKAAQEAADRAVKNAIEQFNDRQKQRAGAGRAGLGPA